MSTISIDKPGNNRVMQQPDYVLWVWKLPALSSSGHPPSVSWTRSSCPPASLSALQCGGTSLMCGSLNPPPRTFAAEQTSTLCSVGKRRGEEEKGRKGRALCKSRLTLWATLGRAAEAGAPVPPVVEQCHPLVLLEVNAFVDFPLNDI